MHHGSQSLGTPLRWQLGARGPTAKVSSAGRPKASHGSGAAPSTVHPTGQRLSSPLETDSFPLVHSFGHSLIHSEGLALCPRRRPVYLTLRVWGEDVRAPPEPARHFCFYTVTPTPEGLTQTYRHTDSQTHGLTDSQTHALPVAASGSSLPARSSLEVSCPQAQLLPSSPLAPRRRPAPRPPCFPGPLATPSLPAGHPVCVLCPPSPWSQHLVL